MKLAYGIHGYGRGHASRAIGLLPELAAEYDVHAFAGNDAFDLISRAGYTVERIPSLSYEFSPSTARYSIRRTLGRNLPLMADAVFGGPVANRVRHRFKELGIDVVLSDSEPWTQRAANRLGIPLVSLDHYAVFAYCHIDLPAGERVKKFFTSALYRSYMGRPQHIIASAFFPAIPRRVGVHSVGTIIRNAIKIATPIYNDFLLVYFNKGDQYITSDVEHSLAALGCEVRIYGSSKVGKNGTLVFKPIDPDEFTRDLISCRAVISSAGNQLMGETMWLGKPVMVIPENSVDQRLNAHGVTLLGIGIEAKKSDLSSGFIRDHFLAREHEFRKACLRNRKDASHEVLSILRKATAEYRTQKAPAVKAVSPVPEIPAA